MPSILRILSLLSLLLLLSPPFLMFSAIATCSVLSVKGSFEKIVLGPKETVFSS